MNRLRFLLEKLQSVCDMQLVKIVNERTSLKDKEVDKNMWGGLKF